MSDLFSLTLEDKLYRTKYEPDAAHPHITVNDDACLSCSDKPCLASTFVSEAASTQYSLASPSRRR